MEVRSIQSLLAENPKQIISGVVTHFEDLKNMVDDDGDDIEAIVLALAHNGVVLIGTCVVDLDNDGDEDNADTTAVERFKEQLQSCFQDGTAIDVIFSPPGSDAKYGWPMVRPNIKPADGEGEQTAENK